MICPKCKGNRMVFKRIENTVVLGRCPMCDGLGEIKGTNFQRITASPEALTIFIEDIMMPCYGCNVESIKNCPHKKKSGVRFCDRKECFKWLNQESKE